MKKLLFLLLLLIPVTILASYKIPGIKEHKVTTATKTYVNGDIMIYRFFFKDGLECVTVYRGGPSCNWSKFNKQEQK